MNITEVVLTAGDIHNLFYQQLSEINTDWAITWEIAVSCTVFFTINVWLLACFRQTSKEEYIDAQLQPL